MSFVDDDDLFNADRADEGDEDDGIRFADPGGKSALRAATPGNPRDRPCPTCRRENALTPLDVSLGYQCDACAERDEGHGP